MAAAANYAWVNRSTMTFLSRQAFGKVFKSTPDDLDMHVIYDVSHNIAKIEEHVSFAYFCCKQTPAQMIIIIITRHQLFISRLFRYPKCLLANFLANISGFDSTTHLLGN